MTNTQKKNPISFKLDLSKCTNQQSEDDEDDYPGGQGAEEFQDIEGGSLEIPGLQYVKVTDDSFRQFSKHAHPNKSVAKPDPKEEVKVSDPKQAL